VAPSGATLSQYARSVASLSVSVISSLRCVVDVVTVLLIGVFVLYRFGIMGKFNKTFKERNKPNAYSGDSRTPSKEGCP